MGVDDATVTQVAQRNEITRQLIYAWHDEMKRKGLWSKDDGAVFLPFDIPAHGVPAIAVVVIDAATAGIELRLRNGRSLHFDSRMTTVALTQLIRAVEAA